MKEKKHTNTGTHLSIFRLLNFCLCLPFFLLLLCDLRLGDTKLRINLLIYLQIHISHFSWGVLMWVNYKGKFDEGWKIWPSKAATPGSTTKYYATLRHPIFSVLIHRPQGWIAGWFCRITWAKDSSSGSQSLKSSAPSWLWKFHRVTSENVL